MNRTSEHDAPACRRWWLVGLTALALAAAALAAVVFLADSTPPVPPPPPPPDDPIAACEAALAGQQCGLVQLRSRPGPGVVAVRYTWQAVPAPPGGWYLRNRAAGAAVRIQPAPAGMPPSPAALHVYADAIVQKCGPDGAVSVLADGDGWELFEVTARGTASALEETRVHPFEMADGFMREELAQDDGWRTVSGRWQLNQHGGGLPSNRFEAMDPKFQRAVNPFTVLGQGDKGSSGVFAYDTAAARSECFIAEASFYYGRPRKDARDDQLRAAPPCFLIGQGDLDGAQVGFGWWREPGADAACWCLCRRHGTSEWEVLERWPDRPPRCNWVRVGVGTTRGHVAHAYLDGRELGSHVLTDLVAGTLHIHTGLDGEPVEFDDVAARPVHPATEDLGQPVLAESTNFGAKYSHDEGRDPEQFEQWARGSNTYQIAARRDDVLGLRRLRAVTRLPLYGDFTYRSTPSLRSGEYAFLVLSTPEPASTADCLARFAFTKDADGWALPATGEGAAPGREFTLEFGRRSGELLVRRQGEWQAAGVRHDGPVHLMIVPPPGQAFDAAKHGLHAANIWHELFERAPADWYWHDGMFGMNLRWACQEGWNFMVGRSPRLCAMFSKAAYHGDQQIDCYLALTATLPKEREYYIRRDLGVSFCTDGRNLDSGYTLVMGGESNTRTFLLKRGVEIASTTEQRFLFPSEYTHQAVHWKWWGFNIRKADGRLLIRLNGELLFDVADPDPVPGGQLAFWTVGNGFVLSRVTTVAEKRTATPERALVFGRSEADLPWRPAFPDAVIMRRSGPGVTVENPFGGGIFAVRRACDVELSQTPVLELPLRVGDAAKINLHVEISRGRGRLVGVAGPVAGTSWLLTPSAERGLQYGRREYRGRWLKHLYLGDVAVQDDLLRLDLGQLLESRGLRSRGPRSIVLTLGNSSNQDYLMAGLGGNRAGATYWVGEPRWLAGTESQ